MKCVLKFASSNEDTTDDRWFTMQQIEVTVYHLIKIYCIVTLTVLYLTPHTV